MQTAASWFRKDLTDDATSTPLEAGEFINNLSCQLKAVGSGFREVEVFSDKTIFYFLTSSSPAAEVLRKFCASCTQPQNIAQLKKQQL